VLSVPGDDGDLLCVFTNGIELVGESGLELLACDVGQLCFSDKGLGFGTDKFLFENDNSRAVWFLVFQLGDLVGDLLLAVSGRLYGSFDVADGLDGHTVLVVAVDELIFELANLVDEDTELVSDITDVFVATFTPYRELLLSERVSIEIRNS
jgi:hypothetical protein